MDIIERYKNKEPISDGFEPDLTKDPAYQKWMADQDAKDLNEQLKEDIENEF